MGDPRLVRILEALRASRFAELRGTRVSATIPIAASLLNALIGAAVPANAPVRDVSVQPRSGNRLALRAKLSRADFLPAMTLTAEIVQQPELPDSPLVLRILSLPGLMSLAGAAISTASLLPPGVRMENQHVLVDIPVLLERHGHGEILPFLESVRLTTDEGRLIADVTVRV